MKEKEKRKQRRNCCPSLYCRRAGSYLIDSKFLQTEAYIDAQCKGSYKKKPKSEGYYRGKMEKYQKQMQTGHSIKSRNEQQEEQC